MIDGLENTTRPAIGPAPTFEKNLVLTAKGGGIVAAGRVVAYGGRFIIAFLLARLLGAEEYGLYSLALSAATITASVSLLGLDDALMRYVAILASRKDENGLWGTLQICIGVSVVASILLGTALFVLAEPISVFLFHEPRLTALLRLISVTVPFLTMSEILAFATRGFKKMEYSVIAENIGQLLIRLALLGGLALIGLDAFRAVIVFGVSDLCASLILVFFLNKEFRLKRPIRGARYEIRQILSFSLPLWMSGLLSTFRSNIQTLLLGTLNTIINVGIFSVVSKINLVGLIIFRAIITSFKPIIAELHERKDIVQLGRLYQTTSRWAFTLNLPIFLVVVLFPQPILSIFGKSFEDGALALVILACAQLVNVSTGLCGSIIDMTGYTRLKLINSITQIVMLFGMNILLIPRWGLLGAAVAELAGTTIVNVMRLVQVWVLFRLLPYNSSFLKPIASTLVALLATLAAGRLISVEANLLSAGLHALFVLLVFTGTLLALGLTPDDRLVMDRGLRRVRAVASHRRTTFRGAR